MSERDFNSRSFSSLACLAVRTLKNSVTALETLPSSPRMETSRRPVLMVRERSEICLSCACQNWPPIISSDRVQECSLVR